MTKKTTVILILIVVTLLVAAVATYKVVQKNKNTINEETKEIFSSESKDFTYTDINGNEVSLEQYLGKILVVTSWASWSPFSKNDLVDLDDLASNYSQSEVVFIAINRKETKEMAERYMNTLPDLDNILIVLDPSDHFYTAVSGYAMPETVVFDTKGEVVLHVNGVVKTKDIKDEIEILTKNPT